jgi:hypothetical protein
MCQFTVNRVGHDHGASTSRPSAAVSAAIETCCKSIPIIWDKPRVIATVTGIDMATSSALRHSMKSNATAPR